MIRWGSSGPTPKDPIRIIGTKVKKIKVRTIIEITSTTATTMPIGLGTMT